LDSFLSSKTTKTSSALRQLLLEQVAIVRNGPISLIWPISIPNTRYYRYQSFEEKYRYWQEISIVSILLSLRYSFHFGPRTHHENDKKSLNRRKYYQSNFKMKIKAQQMTFRQDITKIEDLLANVSLYCSQHLQSN
jgi:hypothetical protein